MSISEVSNIVQIASGLAVLISVFYVALQLKLIRQTHVDNHDWNRRKAAQEITLELNNILADSDQLQRELNFMNRMETIPLDEVLEAIKKDSATQLRIGKILNAYNSVARGVLHGVYDKELIASARKNGMIKAFDSFQSYIIFRRKQSISSLWDNYESLINEWKSEMTVAKQRKNTG